MSPRFLLAILCLASATPAMALDGLLDAGYVALSTCSGVFVARRPLAAVRAEELQERGAAGELVERTVNGKPADIVVDYTGQRVLVAVAAGAPPMVAVHNSTLGCRLIPFGADAAPLARQSGPEVTRADGEQGEAAWRYVAPVQVVARGTDKRAAARLEPVARRLFTADGYGKNLRTLGFIVIRDGTVLVERYRDGFGPHTQYRTWSTSKSLAGALVGVALADGVVASVDEPLALAEWPQTDARARITFAHALNMTSGLQSVIPEDGSDTPWAYWAGIDVYADLAVQPLLFEPGRRHHYANYDTLLLGRALRDRLGGSGQLLAFAYRRLIDRIGMVDTYLETDPYWNPILSSQTWTTPRDLAKLAHLYMKGGRWEGEQILPRDWARFSCTPTDVSTSTASRYGYGAQWWTVPTAGRSPAGQPITVCMSWGYRGQHAAFVPEYGLLVVRTGLDEPASGADGLDVKRLFEEIIEAVR